MGGYNEALSICEDLDLCVKMFFGIKDNKDTRYTSFGSRQRLRHCGARFVFINRCVHTSGRRVAEWGSWNSLKLFLVFCISYAYGASPASLNELGNKEYKAIR